MTTLPFIFIAGLLGSSHCIGMCGPFSLAVGSGASTWRANVGRQLTYTVGRVFTYMVFGAIAASGGLYLHQKASLFVNIAAVLSIIAGAFLIYQGLSAAGVIWRRKASVASMPCLAGEFLRSLLKSPGVLHVFLAGLFTGMLPCGLVYGFLALAASSGNVITGASVMIAFGLGTAPFMILTGCSGSFLSGIARKHIFHVAAWCLVIVGAISIARGFGFIEITGWVASSGCPMCDSQ